MLRAILVTMALMACIGCGSDSAEKYLQQGVAHFQKQEYDLAISSYEKALKLEPKSSSAYNLLGMAYHFKYNQLGNPEFKQKEIAAFQKAVDIDPRNWGAMINLGATYYYMGEKAKAAALFKQALAVNPDHPEKAELEKMIAAGEGRK